jgi:type II secretory pathway pseudopilin PulG
MNRLLSKALNNESGVTLIELMFAVGIMAMALAFIFGSLIDVAKASDLTQSRSVAVTHVATVMEEVQSLGYDALLAYQPPQLRGLGYSETIQVQCIKADGTAIQLPVSAASLTQPLPNPLQVECTVGWRDEKGHSFSLKASRTCLR